MALLFAAQFAFAICALTGLVTECCLPFPVTDAVRAGVRPRVAVGASVIGNESVRKLLGEARSRSLPATQEGVTVVMYCAAATLPVLPPPSRKTAWPPCSSLQHCLHDWTPSSSTVQSHALPNSGNFATPPTHRCPVYFLLKPSGHSSWSAKPKSSAKELGANGGGDGAGVDESTSAETWSIRPAGGAFQTWQANSGELVSSTRLH